MLPDIEIVPVPDDPVAFQSLVLEVDSAAAEFVERFGLDDAAVRRELWAVRGFRYERAGETAGGIPQYRIVPTGQS